MFQWNEEMVRFMRTASEYGDYHRRLVQRMRPALHSADHICDAGCGLGYLSLALAPYVRRVTAADRSEAALDVLRQNCAARGIRNIDILSGELQPVPLAAPYDAMVFCFFGRMEEIAAVAKAQCRGTVFVFKKNYTSHRFSVGEHPAGWDSFRAGADWLTERGVPFEAETLEPEMGQPFRSMEEARQFFRLYSRDADKAAITDEFLRGRLAETGRED
ncbi:MAG: methyltransferase domain-containing protein, partial [Oscillospiraceae bacterium]|nr:methyltransferase domain-containing protein [Oscillospiraceae bacterium]